MQLYTAKKLLWVYTTHEQEGENVLSNVYPDMTAQGINKKQIA